VTTQSIKTVFGPHGVAGFFEGIARAARDDLAQAAAGIAEGSRAARDCDRLGARRGRMSREQIAREVFERNFA
jgi:hypothetical protein